MTIYYYRIPILVTFFGRINRQSIIRVSSNSAPRPIKYCPQFPQKLDAIDSATSCGLAENTRVHVTRQLT